MAPDAGAHQDEHDGFRCLYKKKMHFCDATDLSRVQLLDPKESALDPCDYGSRTAERHLPAEAKVAFVKS